MKRALITGVTGQDGAYLAKYLLEKGYEVHGIKRRSSLFNTQRIDSLYLDPHDQGARLFLHYGDLTDAASLIHILKLSQPDEVYNLGAQSHVKVSFDLPEYTADVNALGTLRLLEAIRILGMGETVKFYQASSSELFGLVQEIPQRESTPFYPRSPYAVAKLFGYWITANYRESYNMFACNGILFNHESPLRGETFVTRKITQAVARIHLGLQKCLYLGNLNAKRDWGFAGDYVRAMWLILQQEQANDYVIGTGETHSVREFVELAFSCIGRRIEWRGSDLEEKGIDSKTGKTVVQVDPVYFRPSEVDYLLADPAKAQAKLNWMPSVRFEELVAMMVKEDLQAAENECVLKASRQAKPVV